MKKLIDCKIEAFLTIEANILKDLKFGGLPLDLGAVTLTVGSRNYILDITYTTFNNEQTAGTKLTLECDLEIDLDTFAKGDEYNYELLISDLKSKELKATIFIGGEQEDSINVDIKNAEKLLFIIVDDSKPIEINLELD